MGNRPTHRLSISRKDGQEISFVDYKGNTQSRKFAPIGALFPSRIEGGFSIALDRKVTLDPETLWINVYPIDMRRDADDAADGGEAAPAPRSNRARKSRAAATDALFDDGADLPD